MIEDILREGFLQPLNSAYILYSEPLGSDREPQLLLSCA